VVVLIVGLVLALPRLAPSEFAVGCPSPGARNTPRFCFSVPGTAHLRPTQVPTVQPKIDGTSFAGSAIVPGPGYFPLGFVKGEFCTEDRSIVWTIPISRWAIPPGCFGLIFHPNPMDFLVNGREILPFGYCEWWPEALLRNPNVLQLPWHTQPEVGVPVWYNPPPGQVGHYAFVESIGTGVDAGWILISEMNMHWRGGGWGAVDYRYIRVDYPGAEYLY
jgi:hypothetical protein